MDYFLLDEGIALVHRNSSILVAYELGGYDRAYNRAYVLAYVLA